MKKVQRVQICHASLAHTNTKELEDIKHIYLFTIYWIQNI